MRSIATITIALLLAAAPACGDDTPTPTPDAADVADTTAPADVADPDAVDPDAADTGPADAEAPDTTPARTYSFRAIGGMSMGAAAITIALEGAGDFDFVGALGGYADTTYMMAQMLRLHFGGFCPLADLEARLEDLDDPAADPPITCGMGLTRSPLEVPQAFNRLAYDNNGITMTRGFYGDVIENFSAAYGNLAVPATAEFPYLPAGVDPTWFFTTPEATRCQSPQPVPARYAFNAEYNPEGAYPVIPLCDISSPSDPAMPDSWFDVAAPRNNAMPPLLAVDLNANGRRDLGEPLLLNPWERYRDVGPDGCDDAHEDGLGGCLSAPAALAPGADPNGDRYDWIANPAGLEANDAYDLGEPFDDLGLDGVAAATSGFSDHGEGNGVWDAVDALATLLDHDADSRIRAVDPALLETMDFWLDGGIRDVLHAGVAARNLVAALRSRGREVRVYHDFGGRADALAPEVDPYSLINEVFGLDLSPEALGRDIYIEYGDPDASAAQIADGDGKHVGRPIDALNRLVTFLVAALKRWPDGDLEPAEMPNPAAYHRSFYSAGLQARRGYTIGLPPGYEDPLNADKRYPVLYFLHGLGQDASDLAAAAAATALLMAEGRVPKAIFIFPDCGCCYRDRDTGLRECACREGEGVMHCVDPACTGADDTCAVRDIPSGRLERECVKGSFYANMRANRWGEARTDLGYRQSVHDLVEHIDATWRTRTPTR